MAGFIWIRTALAHLKTRHVLWGFFGCCLFSLKLTQVEAATISLPLSGSTSLAANQSSAQSGCTLMMDAGLSICGYTLASGASLTFLVAVSSAANYNAAVLYANGSGVMSDVNVFLDGSSVASFNLPATSSWSSYEYTPTQTLALSAGVHTISIASGSLYPAYNLSGMLLNLLSPRPVNVALSGKTSIPASNSISHTGCSLLMVSGVSTCGYNQSSGVSIVYSVSVSSSAYYNLSVLYSNGSGTASNVNVVIDGNAAATMSLPATASWSSYVNSASQEVLLSAGTHLIAIDSGSDYPAYNLSAIDLAFASLLSSASVTRNWQTWPFTQISPWNTPIGSNATFAEVPSVNSLPAGINVSQWTVAVGIATSSSPLVNLLLTQKSWSFLTRQGGANCNNSAARESTLRSESSSYTASNLQYQMNTWSTISGNSTIYQQPASYLHASATFTRQFYMPSGVCPSPDTDGLLEVIQPNGFSMDASGAIVLSNGDTVASVVATYVDLRNSDGTGYYNGRRASMIPALAGLIRKGEIATGVIPHALAINVPTTILKNQAVWPAYAFDRNSGYSGNLPMGTLLAIRPSININALGLSTQGKVMATALQNFGAYIVDRGGTGVSFYAELNASDATWSTQWSDLGILMKYLRRVINNSQSSVGGGGTPRTSLAPPFAN